MANHKKCIDKIRKQIMKADPNIRYVRFDLANITDGSKTDMTGQRIEVGYENKKKVDKSFIEHDFCPFCGGKY